MSSTSVHSIQDFVPPQTFKPSSYSFKDTASSNWIIIILLLALFGFNIFYYLAKGTEETAGIIEAIFGPILRFFGYSALNTTKQTIETTATGTKAGVDVVAGASTGVIDTALETQTETQVAGQTQVAQTQVAQTQVQPYMKAKVAANKMQTGENIDQWQKDSLSKALNDAKQSYDTPLPDDSRSSIQTTGKSGWCYIGQDQGIRTCSEIGVNDTCMSGDVFPTQAVCMNPNLRA
jgi:hypothetical protein